MKVGIYTRAVLSYCSEITLIECCVIASVVWIIASTICVLSLPVY